MKLKIKVYPNSGKQEIQKGDEIKVYLKSQPEDNRANIELLKLLKKEYKKDIKILSGKSSRKKIIEVIDENKI